MAIWISNRTYKKNYCYSLEDFEGRKFKTLLSCSGGWINVWLLGLVWKESSRLLAYEFTRHELHFPDVHFYNDVDLEQGVRAALVFSSSLSRWVFVVLCRYTRKIWFSMERKGAWDHVSSNFPILDLHDFKGKIYTIGIQVHDYRLCELSLDPNPKLTLLKTKNFPDPESEFMGFVSSGENLFVVERILDEYSFEIHELDFGEMKWVSPEEKTMEEHAFFVSDKKHNNAAIKPELWSDSWLPYKRYASSDTNGNDMFFRADM